MSTFWRRRSDQQQSNNNNQAPLPLLEDVVSQLQLAETWYQSASTLRTKGEFEEAIVLYRKAIAVFEKEEPDGSRLCQSYYGLGTSYRRVGLNDESVECYDKSLQSKVKNKSSTFLSNCHYSKATSLRCSGNYNQAAVQYQKAIDICERSSPGSGSTVLALSFVGLASFHSSIGEFRQAEDLFERAFAILACLNPDSEAYGSANYHCGMFCTEKEEWDRALDMFKIANQCYLHHGNLEGIAACQREIAMILVQQNRSNTSTEVLLDQALMTLLFNGKRQTVELASTHTARGILYMARSDYKNAQLSFQKSEKILALKAPHSFEFAKMCIAIGELLKAQRDLGAAVGRYEQALSVYDHYHSRSPMRERIIEKIEALQIEIAADSEVQTGIRTAIATPLEMSLRSASRNPWFQEQAVIAMPADLCTLVSECPLANEIFSEQENFLGPLHDELLDRQTTTRVACTSASANETSCGLQSPFNQNPLPQFKDQVRDDPPFYKANFPPSSQPTPLAGQICDTTPAIADGGSSSEYNDQTRDFHLLSTSPTASASHDAEALPALNPVSPRSVMDPPSSHTADDLKPAAVKLPKLRVLVVGGDNGDNHDNQMHLSSCKMFDVMTSNVESGELHHQDAETINPDVIVTNLRNIQECSAESDLQHELPQGLKLIKRLRRNGKVTPIILFANSLDEEICFKDETMRFGGNGIVSDADSLHDILLKFRNDLLSENNP
jgi:tetratricopeptide (TPR) repeat protein